MANFYTTREEEELIHRVRKDGFGYDNELHKYYILRIALSLALGLEKMALDNPLWKEKKLGGERDKEYSLELIAGKEGDAMLRAMLYALHQEEMDERACNVFDDRDFMDVLSRYIHRGLFEMRNTWKSGDCFYQWCLDHLHFASPLSKEGSGELEPQEYLNTSDLLEKIKNFYKQHAIPIVVESLSDSYRHKVCRIKVGNDAKLRFFEQRTDGIEKVLGVEKASYRSCNHLGLSSTYEILIGKPRAQWQSIGKEEFLRQSLKQPLDIFAGYTIEGRPFIFNLLDSKHLIVGGTTGSGKTTFLQSLILSLLMSSKDCELVFVDPKGGVASKPFETCNRVKIITEALEAIEYLKSLVEEMEERYGAMAQGERVKLYKIVVIDELNDLIHQDKEIIPLLSRLAIKAREAGIYLVLGTQRPDAKVLAGELRSNIVSRIALRVVKVTESKIILDEGGAEKLLGNGDMLIKIEGQQSLQNVFGFYLTSEDIGEILANLRS